MSVLIERKEPDSRCVLCTVTALCISLTQERLNILESGFENMVTEVETQMAGIQVFIQSRLPGADSGFRPGGQEF